MNLTQNPELLDRPAASYSLGNFARRARRRFEQLAREYPQVRAATLLCKGRWSTFSRSPDSGATRCSGLDALPACCRPSS